MNVINKGHICYCRTCGNSYNEREIAELRAELAAAQCEARDKATIIALRDADLAAAKAAIRRLAISSVTANPGTLHHYKCVACGGRWSGRPTDAEQHAAGCDAAMGEKP